jgi:hypothetical protein
MKKQSYLQETISNSYDSYSENRLTQIFSATFNNSNSFKKSFLKLISSKVNGIKYNDINTIVSQTQVSFNNDSIIDMIIYDDNNAIIVIENKIDADFGNNQLEKYDNIIDLQNTIKIILVKYYYNEKNTNWIEFHWIDIYKILFELINNRIDENEYFILNEFMFHLKELNMYIQPIITISELEKLKEGIINLRSDKPSFSLANGSIFEIANSILKYFEEIIEISKSDSFIYKKIGRNYRFSPWITWWINDDDINNKNISIHIRTEIRLDKKINNINMLCIGYYVDIPKNKYFIKSVAQNGVNFEQEETYHKKDLILDELSEFTINTWKNWLK